MQYLDYLTDPSFREMNKLFVVSFEKIGIEQVIEYIPTAEIRHCNVMTDDGQNMFGQPVKSDVRTYENIRKIANGQGDAYRTGYLLGYQHFKENCKLIAIDIGKQLALNADLKAIQQINFPENLD